MEYRKLGDTGMRISEIGLGGWLTFGNALGDDQTKTVLDAAFDCGINFLDNANAYARGKCESTWGRLLKDRRRDDYVLATKVFFPMGEGPNDRGLSRKHITEQCAASLKRLKTDHIDLYQCHRPDPETPLEETVRALDDLVRQGKVVYWGFSMWDEALTRQTIELCDARGYSRPVSSQPPYNAINREWQDVFEYHASVGIGQVCYSPLAQGVLTGKYKPNEPAPGNSRAKDDRQNQFIKSMTDDNELLAKVQKLQPIAEENGCSMAQLALAWCLRRPEVSSVIIGATKPGQVTDNAEASGITLDDEHIAAIDAALAG